MRTKKQADQLGVPVVRVIFPLTEKFIVSPLRDAVSAARRVPAPLLAALVTVIVAARNSVAAIGIATTAARSTRFVQERLMSERSSPRVQAAVSIRKESETRD